MAIDKNTFMKPLAPAGILTAAVLALQYVGTLIGNPVQNLFSSISPVSPVTPTIGNTFLQYLGGYIPIGSFFTSAIIVLFISAYLILLAGYALVEMAGVPVAKGRVGRTASIILWGAALFYVLIVGLVMKSWTVIAGLAIYTVIAAYIVGWLADLMNVEI